MSEPKRVVRKPTVEESTYIECRTITFEVEANEAMDARHWDRLETIFLDFGVFLERHPNALVYPFDKPRSNR